MKNTNGIKTLGIITIVIVICFLLFACGSRPASVPITTATQDELDTAIRETSNYLNNQLNKGSKLLILNIQSNFPALSEYIIDELIANTVNDRVFSAVDRRQLDAIRTELDFQYSGDVDDDTAQKLGRMAGAQIIISGAVSKIGDLYRLRIRALSVQSAQIEGQFNRNIPDGPIIAALIKSQATGYGTGTNYSGTGGRSTASRDTRPGAEQAAASGAIQSPAAPAAPAAPVITYKIGDKGPAGGIIFFDKTSFSNGWRYLEAAPASTEVKASWDTCVQMIKAYEINGTKGWRLPSKDELDWIYSNLKQKGLGEFGDGVYWTSEEVWGHSARAMRLSNGEWLRTGMLAGDDMCVGKNNSLTGRAVRQF